MSNRPFFVCFWILTTFIMAATVMAQSDLPRSTTSAAEKHHGAALLDWEHPLRLPNAYIVVLKEQRSLTETESYQRTARVIATVASLVGSDVTFVYDAALQGFAGVFSDESVQRLAANPEVAWIEADKGTYGGATAKSWGLDRVDQRSLPLDDQIQRPNSGAGVHAYILDSGIRASHSEFRGRVGNGYDFISNDNNPADCHGHGTHVAGTVGGATYGVAPGVILHGVRVLDCNNWGSYSAIIAGVDWVTRNHIAPAVANMSIGGDTSTSLDNAVQRSINVGVVYCISAGNDNRNACNYSPARVSAAITVGATASNDYRANFSNYGSCIDIFAPGVDIRSAWYTSDTRWGTMSGTSMASPHVCGAAAQYRSVFPDASVAQVTNFLLNAATNGAVRNPGSSSPNKLLYLADPGDGGGDDPPCSDCTRYSGRLDGVDDYQVQPNGDYYWSAAGTHEGWLRAEAGVDFDLRVYRWNGDEWVQVGYSTSPTENEFIRLSNMNRGYYYWRIESYAGAGNYDFYLSRP